MTAEQITMLMALNALSNRQLSKLGMFSGHRRRFRDLARIATSSRPDRLTVRDGSFVECWFANALEGRHADAMTTARAA